MPNARLKNRQAQIPGGLTYFLPQTQWRPREHSSFQGITEALYYHLQANPRVLATLGWPLDMQFIADKVDEYNSEICQKMGWLEYIQAGGGQPGRPFPGVAAPVQSSEPRKACCGGSVHR